MFQTQNNYHNRHNSLVLIPSEQGNVSNSRRVLKKANPLVLIPSEQGNVSNSCRLANMRSSTGLNPFGTGKCFKRLLHSLVFRTCVLIPSEQGNVSNICERAAVSFGCVLIPSEQGNVSNGINELEAIALKS